MSAVLSPKQDLANNGIVLVRVFPCSQGRRAGSKMNDREDGGV